MELREHKDSFRVEFENGVSVEIRRQGGTFGGIGRVRCGTRDLRSPELPILPLIISPDGYRVHRLEIEQVRPDDEGVVLTLRPYVDLSGRTEERDRGGEDCWNVASWAQQPVRDRGGMVWLRLKEANRRIGDMELRGFSYGYKFRSRKYRVCRLHDRATWELNGRATGNVLYMRGHPEGPRRVIRNKKDEFTTARLDGDGLRAQFRPLFTELQGFSFQFTRSNVLVTAFQEPFPCMSLLQKSRGWNYIVHWHQLCGDGHGKAGSLDFPALEVLCADSVAREESKRLSQYEAVRGDLSERYHRAFGLQREQAVCCGELHASSGLSKAELGRGVARLAGAGCTEVIVPGLLVGCDKLAPGRGGRSEATADAEGARERIRTIVGLAHRRGMEVGTFLGPAAVQGVNENGPQGPGGGKGDALGTALAALKREFALDVLYLEAGSRAAHSQDPTGGGGAGSGNELATAIAFHRAAQQQGYRFGRNGPDLFGLSGRAVPYRVLRHNEFFYRDSAMRFPHEEVLAAGDDPHEAYFRGYANRLCYRVRFGGKDGGRPGLDAWWDAGFAAVNRAYTLVEEHMRFASALPGGKGVLWSPSAAGDDVRVLWAFVGFTWQVGEQASAYDVMAAGPVKLEGGRLEVQPNRVYLVQEVPDRR